MEKDGNSRFLHQPETTNHAGECKGTFLIIDSSSRPMAGVWVSYRTENGIWIFSGISDNSVSTGHANFVQQETVYHGKEEAVSWRFSKDGFMPITLTRLAASGRIDEKCCLITLHRYSELNLPGPECFEKDDPA